MPIHVLNIAIDIGFFSNISRARGVITQEAMTT
jgi:hypothetical protein